MDIESAVDLMVQPEETTEEVEEVAESELEQPEEDSYDDADDDDEDADVEDVDESEVEETDDEDEDYEDAEEDDESEDPTEDVHTVKVDGEEKQVTLDELKRSYSGQQYIQKGMQQAAEVKKQAEEAYYALMRERESVQTLVQQAQSGVNLIPPAEPDSAMFENDPLGYMEAKIQYDNQVKEYNANAAKFQEVLNRQSEAEQIARAEYARQEANKLVEVIPELADAGKASKFKESIMKAASHYGYSPEEVAAISSSRDFVVLRDAMRWQELQAGKETVKKKVNKAPPIKAGAKKVRTNGDKARKAKEKLKRSGSIEDALALIVNS
jgi:hypothetical protein